MVVGIMFIFLGVILILVTAKGMSLDNKTTYIIGGLFLTVGILLIIFDFIDYSNGMLVCIGGSVGSLFIWAGTRSIYKTFRCTMKIEATYMGSSSYTNTKGVTTYTPKFRFRINNRQYEKTSGEFFSKRYIEKKYKTGYTYKIYVDPKNPNEFVTRKRLSLMEINLLVMGLLFIWVVIRDIKF